MDDAALAAAISARLGLTDFKEAIVSRAILLLKRRRESSRGKAAQPEGLAVAATAAAICYTLFPREIPYRAMTDAARAAGSAIPGSPDALHALVQGLQGAICAGHEAYPMRRMKVDGAACATCFALLPSFPPGFAPVVPTRLLAAATAAVQGIVKAGASTIEDAMAGAVKAFQRARITLGDRATANVIAGIATMALDGARFGDLAKRLCVPRATLREAVLCIQGKDGKEPGNGLRPERVRQVPGAPRPRDRPSPPPRPIPSRPVISRDRAPASVPASTSPRAPTPETHVVPAPGEPELAIPAPSAPKPSLPMVDQVHELAPDATIEPERQGLEAGDSPAFVADTLTRDKWLASAAKQAKALAEEFPALQPAVDGAVALLERSIDSYITSDKVQRSQVQKLAKLALLHEAKAMNIPVTTKTFSIAPTDYLQFVARSGASRVPVPAVDDEALVDQALDTIARCTGHSIDAATRERLGKLRVTMHHALTGFTPRIAAVVLAFIDLARSDPDFVMSEVASVSGINASGMYSAVNRFLAKIGKPGDPAASTVERVLSAFPPVAKGSISATRPGLATARCNSMSRIGEAPGLYSARVGKVSATSPTLGFYMPRSLASELHLRPGDEFVVVFEQVENGDERVAAMVDHAFKMTDTGWCAIDKHRTRALHIQDGTAIFMRVAASPAAPPAPAQQGHPETGTRPRPAPLPSPVPGPEPAPEPAPRRALAPKLVKVAASLVGEAGKDAGKAPVQRMQAFVLDHHARLTALPDPGVQPVVVAAIELERQGAWKAAGKLAQHANLTTADLRSVLEEYEALVGLEAPEPPLDTRGKWLASARAQAKMFASKHPALKPAVPGAVDLLGRSIDTYITSEKVAGSTVLKLVKLALLHEAKALDIPFTTKAMNVAPTDYLQFLARSGAASVPVSSAEDAVLVDRALEIMTAYTGTTIDAATRARVTRFQAVTRRKLMGFTPAITAAVLAFIDVARHDPATSIAKLATAAGVRSSSLFNSTARFLRKVGKATDPESKMVDQVRAAFPPRD